jgi:hypothetical protein
MNWFSSLFSRQPPLKYPPPRSEWEGRIVLACPSRCTGGEINWAGWISYPKSEASGAQAIPCPVCGKTLQGVAPP